MSDSRIVSAKGQVALRRLRIVRETCGWIRPLAIISLLAISGRAQQATEGVQPSASLGSQFFEHDFVNFFAFGNGIYDSALPKLTTNGSSYGGEFGYDVGGGITAGHNFKDGVFSLAYKGDYRRYEGTNYNGGMNQDLRALFTKRLNRQWSFTGQAGGGIVSYGGQFYGSSLGLGSAVLTNPLSSKSRFANSSLGLTYQQTRRLSYTFGGQFFYNSYNYSGAVSSIGGSGTVSIDYRTTARTTIGATYTRSYFSYKGSLGTTNIDGGYLTLSHIFPGHWTASLSAGVSHSHSKGNITQPISILLGQQIVTGYVTGPYDRTNYSPSFQATITRSMRHSLFSIGGGQGVNAGNGTYLTSRNQFLNGTYSFTHRLTNFSLGGSYSRLSSIANSVSSNYATATASASYGFNIVKYVSANIRYDFIHYDGLYSLHALNESRISAGLTFSSKSVPLTLF